MSGISDASSYFPGEETGLRGPILVRGLIVPHGEEHSDEGCRGVSLLKKLFLFLKKLFVVLCLCWVFVASMGLSREND